MIDARAGLILTAALTLTACASSSAPPETWSGGDPTHLAADQAACRNEAATLDVNDPSTYSDPRYGSTSALAEAVGRDNPLADRGAIVRQAAFETCMNDKGWRSSQ
ncbi:MAG TPA: hypothetical protein VE309_13880 [Caulobacteraceae bacterium]|jgi:hypothetical protein|nr:hypothetical protein [Caulobacteraceae bacterium]